MRTLAVTVLLVFTAGAAFGQSTEAPVAFEVASIKASPPPDGRGMRVGGTGGPGSKDPGRWTVQNMSLSNLITQAYDLKRYQYSGPAWLDTERFDITAKVPEGATREQFRMMIQNMLAERFKLTIHREKKEMTGYDLVVAKNGPKLKETVEVPPTESPRPAGPPLSGPPKLDQDGFPELPPGQGSMMIMMNGRARSRQNGQTTEQLANMLANQVGKPVTDATGLKGKYDYTLSWAAGGPVRVGGPEAGGGPLGAMSDADSGPTIFSAIQEQLGLRLEQKKTTVEMVVVDKIEKAPTEN